MWRSHVRRAARLALAAAILFVPWVAASAAIATPAAPAASGAVADSVPRLDIRTIRLDNGLRIFVLERHNSPTFAGYYQFGVGGAADPAGHTGIAHLLEHMMFKGTTNIGTLDANAEARQMQALSGLWHRLDRELDRGEDPFHRPDSTRIDSLKRQIEVVSEQQKKLIVKNEYDEVMTRAGGESENASTDNDATRYFIQLPANRLELWFRLESNRLLRPVFREFWSERDVVAEERRTSTENNGEALAYETLQGLVFTASPYRNPVLGWPHDVARLKQEDAESYFHTYYSPSNCIMVLVGDVKTADVERLARKYLGSWKRQELPAPAYTTEPPQKGERRAVVEFDAEPGVIMGWRSVPEGNADEYPLDLLSRILGGLESSRLEKTIVQKERIVTDVFAGDETLARDGEFIVGARIQPGHTVAEAEAGIAREIRKIQDQGVGPDELERAKIVTEADRVHELKDNLGQAERIATAVQVSGSPEYMYQYEARVNAVTAAQVQDVARRYLAPERRSVVELRKTPGASGGQTTDIADVHHHGGDAGARGARHSSGFQQAMAEMAAAPPLTLRTPELGRDVQRVELPCGVTAFVKEDHSAPSVEMNFAWLGGSNTTPIAELAPFSVSSELLTQGGTESLDPFALQDRREQLGMDFSLQTGDEEGGASFWSLRRNFPQSFALAMDMLMRPRLDAARLATIEAQYIDYMRRRYDYPAYGAWLIQNHVINRDQPRINFEPTKQQVLAVTPDDVRKIWRRYFGRDNLYVAAVGDFDARAMIDLLQKTFATWRTAQDTTRVFLARAPVVRPGVYLLEKEIAAPAIMLEQQMRVDRTAPLADHAALEVLNDILGGNGFRSRLMERVRSDEGLTYGIESFLSHNGRPGVPGAVGATYETKKVSVARSVASTVDEFHKMATGPVEQAEVQEQIESWRNAFVFKFTNDFATVDRMMSEEIDGRPYDFDERLLNAVQKVTPTDVERVAKQYLRPDDLTISVFGTPTDEDRKALAEKFKLTVLPRSEVFRGGYDEDEKPKAAAKTPVKTGKASKKPKSTVTAKTTAKKQNG